MNNKMKISKNREDIDKLSSFFKKVLLDGDGNIKLVNHEFCRQQKKELERVIEKEKETTAKALRKIDGIDKKIILIMYHLNIDHGKITELSRDD